MNAKMSSYKTCYMLRGKYFEIKLLHFIRNVVSQLRQVIVKCFVQCGFSQYYYIALLAFIGKTTVARKRRIYTDKSTQLFLSYSHPKM